METQRLRGVTKGDYFRSLLITQTKEEPTSILPAPVSRPARTLSMVESRQTLEMGSNASEFLTKVCHLSVCCPLCLFVSVSLAGAG